MKDEKILAAEAAAGSHEAFELLLRPHRLGMLGSGRALIMILQARIV